MQKNIHNSEYSIDIDIDSSHMRAYLTNGYDDLAKYSFVTPKNDFRKFLTMLRALINPIEHDAQEKGVEIKALNIGFKQGFEKVKNKITCRSIPIIHRVNFNDYLTAYRGKINLVPFSVKSSFRINE